MGPKRVLYAGDEIQIETKKGHFRGRIHLKNDDSIYLKEVVELNTGFTLPGLTCFHKNEVILSRFIRGCEKVNENFEQAMAPNLQAIRMFTNNLSSNTMDNVVSNDNNKECANLRNGLDLKMASKIEKLKETLKKPKVSQNCLETTQIDRDTCSSAIDESHYKLNYIVLDSVDNLFYSSITDLKFSKCVGVAFIGSSVKRGTDFSWVAVHAKDFYLYDVRSLGDSAFKEGLKDVFEDPDIVKVVFDCRVASHTLLHMHDSLLTNVLDLMAFDIMAESVSQPICGVPKSMTDLLTCIAGHLSVPMSEVSSQRCRLEEARQNYEYWNVRGSPHDTKYNEMIQAAIFEVAYLKQLKQTLTQKIMRPVVDATDFFLGTLRDRSALQLLATDKLSTPKEFHDRSVLRHAAEKFRNKTSELMKGRNQNEGDLMSDEIDKLYHNGHAKLTNVSNGSDANSSIASSSSSSPLDRKTRNFFSTFMQEKREPNPGVNFAPSGSECGNRRRKK